MLVRQVRNFELVASYDAVTGNMTGRTETDLTALAGQASPAVRTWSYSYDATGRSNGSRLAFCLERFWKPAIRPAIRCSATT